MRSSTDASGWIALDLSEVPVTAAAPHPAIPGLALPELPDRVPPAEARREDAGEAAYERGFADGMDAGLRRATEQIRPLSQALEHVGRALAASQEDFVLDLSRNLSALAIAVAEKVIQREITADPGIVAELVERAIALLPQDTVFTIRLNPHDLERLGHSAVRQENARGVSMAWIADPNLEPGSFLLQTPARLVDGRTDVSLRMLYDRLAYDE